MSMPILVLILRYAQFFSIEIDENPFANNDKREERGDNDYTQPFKLLH